MQEAKKLLSNSLVLFIGTIIGSIFSYLFNMLMGRMLGPERYGEMTALMSTITIVSVGSGAVLTVVMKYSSDLFHQGYFSSLKKLFSKFTQYFLIFSIALFFILLIFSKVIANFFSIENLLPVFITISSIIFGYLIVINRGVLQGLQRFVSLSLTNALEMLLKLIFGIVLVKIGLSLNGSISAIVLSTAIVYFVTLLLVKKDLNPLKEATQKEKFAFDKKEIIAYTMPALISSLLLIVAMNIDVIMVKHLFSANEAGLYSAVSTVGKIILFITAPVISVMFPMISEHKTKGSKHYKVLLLSIILTLLGGLVILGIYAVMPSRILSILYGGGYTGLYYLLPEIGIAFMFYSLVNLLSNYFLAIKDYTFLWFFGVLTLIEITTIWFWHPSITMVVRVIISSFGLLFFLMIGYYLYTKREQVLAYFKGENGEESQAVDNNTGL